jgi:hypothetical protein
MDQQDLDLLRQAEALLRQEMAYARLQRQYRRVTFALYLTLTLLAVSLLERIYSIG